MAGGRSQLRARLPGPVARVLGTEVDADSPGGRLLSCDSAPGPKCLGVKTKPRRGRGGLRSPQLPFPLLLSSTPKSCSHPWPRAPAKAGTPEPRQHHPPLLLGQARQMGSSWLFSRGPGKLPSSARRPNRRPDQTVLSRKGGGLLGATTAGSPPHPLHRNKKQMSGHHQGKGRDGMN